MTTTASKVLFDPRDPMLKTDRYGYYRRLRERDPIHHSPLGFWVVTRYDDADQVLRAPGVTSRSFMDDPNWTGPRGGPNSPVVRSARRWMLTMDGAEHRRLRRLFARALTPQAVARMKPRIAELANQMIDEMGEGEIELISGLALPLPVAVVCELIGIPIEDAEKVREWTNTIADVVGPSVTPQMRVRMNRAEPEFRAYVLDLLAQRRAAPRDDLLTMLVNPETEDERLSDEDIAAQVLVLFNAGHETSVNVIGSGMYELLNHPEQLQLMRDRPELIEHSFDELARYHTAVQIAVRRLTEDVPVGGTTIPAGATVFVALGAAHRDPAKYPDPDRFDITRQGIKTLAFASGPHYCIAALLGKLEVVVAFEELLRRYDQIELATTDLEWSSRFDCLLGLPRLPLRVSFRR